jgi:esterase/lipase superfamily enzyme
MPAMLFVSCRKDFWSSTEFSTVNEIRRVDLTTGTGAAISQNAFLQELASKRVTVLVHGYNNEELDVIESYRAIDTQMRTLGFLGSANGAPYHALVGFAWPGGAIGVSFPFARQRAGESAAFFSNLLSDLRSAGATVDLNTHSLGAHVVFEALREDPANAVRNAWNFASAVDNESIEFNERYFEASQRCTKFYVFHSKHDPVLRVWYRIGDFFDFDTALGYTGPEDPAAIIAHSPHVQVVNCKEVVTSHGGYRSAGQVWAHMSRELATPLAAQFVTLEKTPQILNAEFAAAGGMLLSTRTPSPARRATGRRKRSTRTTGRRR